MEKLVVEKLPRIIKNKKKLESELRVKINNRGREVYIEGYPEDTYIAEKVIEALEFGFPFSTALLLKEEDFMFDIVNIKDYTKRKDLTTVRSRIIGRQGKTLKTITDLTKCHFEIKDNQVGIIGDPEYIKSAQDAVISLIQGSKQGNVYGRIEKRKKPKDFDLGLKPNKK